VEGSLNKLQPYALYPKKNVSCTYSTWTPLYGVGFMQKLIKWVDERIHIENNNNNIRYIVLWNVKFCA